MHGVRVQPEDLPSEAQMAAWRALQDQAAASAKEQRVALARVPTGPTRAAYRAGQHEGPCGESTAILSRG